MSTTTTTSVSSAEIFARIITIQIELHAVKPLYAEMDLLIMDLVARGETTITTADGTTYSIVDNFADRNTVFRPAGVKRYELKEEKRK